MKLNFSGVQRSSAEMRLDMKQYELAIRIAQIHHLVDERKYKKALAVIQTLDMHHVRALSDLKVFAEVYTKTEQYDAAKATYLRIYRRSRTKRILYRLIYLSIRTNSLTEAESYYQEFVRMNPNIRDSLILRYRIDKASGAPAEQLIEILQQLKQEEYIEEWAYELAKLYHRTGRKEECIEECEDIILWFGTGEIVQRARLLIEHLTEKEPIPYEEKDFTLPKPEEPNPYDTGSLPDLEEFIREQKAKKREERKEGWFFRRDYEKRESDREERDEEEHKKRDSETKNADKKEPVKKVHEKDDKGEFIDDYEDSDFDSDGLAIPQIARDGFQMISDLLKFGKKEESKKEEKKEPKKEENRAGTLKEERQGIEEEQTGKQEPKQNPSKQNLPKQEMPKQEILKQENLKQASQVKKEPQKLPEYIPPSQSGTGITQDLAREISAIYEMEQREQLQEKQVTVLDEEEENSANLAENVVQRMTKALQKNPTKTTKTYIPLDVEEIRGDEIRYEVNGPEEITKVIEPVRDEEETENEHEEMMDEVFSEGGESISSEKKLESILEQEVAEIQQVLSEEEKDSYAERKAEQELEGKSHTEAIKELLEEQIEGENLSLEKSEEELQQEESPETLAQEEAAAVREEVSGEEISGEETSGEETSGEETSREEISGEETSGEETAGEETAGEETSEEKISEEKNSEEKISEEKISEEETFKKENSGKNTDVVPEKKSVLDGYKAPEIPVYENSYMQIPDEVSYKDLPTTRALHQSFSDVLQIIRGEQEPSHFVLMGGGTECVVGVAKKIVRTVKEGGFLSCGKIAKVTAEQLNKMDLLSFKNQLKGNCLLVEQAAELLLPTLSLVLNIMDEYEGDFVVILVDEGTTLDQLFRFTPKLVKRFKYIIDISHYSPEDYQ